MDNMELYEYFRTVPNGAKKSINGGRLKGMTDINPVWRIKTLTQRFGPCGIGWKYQITNREFVPGANGEVAVFVDILLFYRNEDGWSDGIPGSGGSMYISKEKSGLYTDDEAPKKALTDAISVAAKALGVGADVYFEKDRTKYDAPPPPPLELCHDCGKPIVAVTYKGKKYSPTDIIASAKATYEEQLCWNCCTNRKVAKDAQV